MQTITDVSERSGRGGTVTKPSPPPPGSFKVMSMPQSQRPFTVAVGAVGSGAVRVVTRRVVKRWL